jgi:HAD superfamily hydrolase (TIGR01490 family)
MGLIAVFDFDGTLIKEDSMVLLFRRYYKSSWGNIGTSLRLVLETIKFFMKINSQKQFKEKYLNLVISSIKNKSLEEITPDFSGFLLKKISKDALREINRLKEKGYETILLSASPDFYLREIKEALGFSKLICTQTTFKDNKIIITGENCYGKSKIARLLEQYPKSSTDWQNSFCFTDNLSDSGLLSLFGNPFAVNNKKLAARNPGFKHLVWK